MHFQVKPQPYIANGYIHCQVYKRLYLLNTNHFGHLALRYIIPLNMNAQHQRSLYTSTGLTLCSLHTTSILLTCHAA